MFGGIGGRGIAALAVFVAASVGTAEAKRSHLESWYADALAGELGAQTEVRMRNGTRCDVLATHHAIEVEFAGKWAEAVGQSLNYAAQTGRRGAIALILEKESDAKFLSRLREVIAWHQLPVVVIVMRPHGEQSLTMEFPAGFKPATRRPAQRAASIDLRAPVAAMDWIPWVRGTVSFEISTRTNR